MTISPQLPRNIAVQRKQFAVILYLQFTHGAAFMCADRLDAAALQLGDLPQAHTVKQKGQNVALTAGQFSRANLLSTHGRRQKPQSADSTHVPQ